MGTISVTYDPYQGLVQTAGGRGVRIGGTISYTSASEAATLVTADLTIADEAFVAVDASLAGVTVTIPPALDGRILTIKKIDATANTVTIQPTGGELIDGGTSAVITIQWTTLTLQGFNGVWYVR